MSLDCCDADFFVYLSDDLIVSRGTEVCCECKSLINCGTEHYTVLEYEDETHIAKKTACEVCGDLALSFLEQGFCWSCGDLRNDIKELREYYK